MNTYCFVRPEHLSHQGFLFGGQLLKWIDEFTWIAAAQEYPGAILVTRAMDNISFTKRVASGSILRFESAWQHQGASSVTYHTRVYAAEGDYRTEHEVFSTNVTFVSVDERGSKRALGARQARGETAK